MKRKLLLLCACVLANAGSLEEMIEGTSIDGMALMRYLSNSGRNDGGQGIIAKVIADLNSGEIEGFSFNIGLFYHYGGIPQQGSKTDGSVNGSRADRLTGTGGNAFGVSTLWGKYSFGELSETNILGGKMRLKTPITNPVNDRGIGAMITNGDIYGLNITAGYFDSWATDSEYIGGFGAFTAGTDYSAYNFGNNLAMIGFDGQYGYHSFRIWYYHIEKMANTIFGEFKAGSELEFSAQVAFSQMFSNPTLKIGDGSGNGLGERLSVNMENAAKSRGLYTLQLAYNPMREFGIKAGFVGSFGAGYGVALTNEATFNKGGRWWFDNFGNGYNGFSMFGPGGYENTHINIWYVALNSSVSIVDLGLDVVGISGKNQYAVSTYKANGAKVDANIFNGNRTFYEITPQLAINVTSKFKISAYYALVFGQINAQRLWTEFLYKF